MIAPEIQAALESPINTAERANRIFLPLGKRKGSPRTEAEQNAALASGRAARARVKQEKADKTSQLLDYYATTSVPADRIAEHIGIDAVAVIREMRARGRAI